MLRRLTSIENEGVHRALELVCVLGVTLASAVATGLLARALQPALERVDRRIGLPWPASACLRGALWWDVPLLAGSGALLLLFSAQLGVLFWCRR